MKNQINLVILVTLLSFFPLFVEGESTQEKSFIQEIKEKITKEKEKVEEKKQETVEVKEKNTNKVEKPAQEESRIEKVKDKIIKEEKKIEEKVVEKKKEKDNDKNKDNDKHDHVYKKDDRNNREYGRGHDKRYYQERYGYYTDWGYAGGYYYDRVPVYTTDVEYVDYVYVDDSAVDIYSPTYTDAPPRKIASLYSSVEASYLGKDIRDTYGVTAKIFANLFYLHFNCFYQNIFSSEETLTIYSINGGLYFSFHNFTLTPFVGAFYIEPLEEARLSYGADLQVTLPGNYTLDFYTINSSYGSLDFNNFSASLNYGFSIFNVGLGYNYNKYAGEEFSGPFVALSLGF